MTTQFSLTDDQFAIQETARKFTADYTAKFGNAPDNWAALGFASMQVVAAAITQP